MHVDGQQFLSWRASRHMQRSIQVFGTCKVQSVMEKRKVKGEKGTLYADEALTTSVTWPSDPFSGFSLGFSRKTWSLFSVAFQRYPTQ
jgi:hypothetical protein